MFLKKCEKPFYYLTFIRILLPYFILNNICIKFYVNQSIKYRSTLLYLNLSKNNITIESQILIILLRKIQSNSFESNLKGPSIIDLFNRKSS